MTHFMTNPMNIPQKPTGCLDALDASTSMSVIRGRFERSFELIFTVFAYLLSIRKGIISLAVSVA